LPTNKDKVTLISYNELVGKTQTIIAFIGGVFNFKFITMIDLRFFPFDNINVPFEHSDSFFKAFTFISLFSLIFTMLNLLIGNINELIFILYDY
jgi:hypothetical protein